MAKHKSLWGFYDGEPFMENPHLVVLNARRKGKKMAKSAKARMAYVRSFQKKGRKKSKRAKVTLIKASRHTHWGKVRQHRRRVNPSYRRRNAFPVAGIVANRRRRRNPSLANFSILGARLPDVMSVVYVGAGFMATPIVETFLNKYIPVSITSNTIGKYAVKLLSVVALTLATKQVLGNDAAKKVAVGGGTYILVSAINSQLGSYHRATTMGSYNRSTQLGAYSPQLRAIGPASGGQSYTGGAAQAGASRFTRTNRFGGRN